jgi:hypothetical protein
MEHRCDQVADCQDQSDEAGCHIVDVNRELYLKGSAYSAVYTGIMLTYDGPHRGPLRTYSP